MEAGLAPSPLFQEATMEKPVLTEEHRALERLAGTWTGPDAVKACPSAQAGASFVGMIAARIDLDGFFLVLDYVQDADGRPVYRGHGVIGFDPVQKVYTLYWFDSASAQVAFGTGGWKGDALVIDFQAGPHRGRSTYQLEGGGLVHRVEMDAEGKGLQTIVEGKYRRSASATSQGHERRASTTTAKKT
jgi:hypothetical protein